MTINANVPTGATNVKYRWWEEPTLGVASALSAAAQNIERYSWQRRLLGLVCSRYFTGREMTALYAYSMARRPASLTTRLRSIDWSVPSDNVIATIADVFRSRIGKARPFVVVVPIAGNFKAYLKSIQMSRFSDAVWHDTNFWDTFETVFDDAMCDGDGFVKVHESATEKKKIAITRVLGDEILVNEEEALYGNPRSLIQRCFMHREELIAKYGDKPEKRDAIWRAPGAYPGLYHGDLNAQDVIPYCEGWHKKGYNSQTDKEEEGRNVVAISNLVLSDVDWKKNRFPFAQLKFSRLRTGFFNQGLVEKLLPYQAELNRYDAADWENQNRISWPRVLNPIGSQATPASLMGASGGIINFVPIAGMAPTFVYPDATNPLAEQRRQRIKQSAYLRARISENTAQAQKPDGLNSGTAIMAWANIEDGAHIDLGQRSEDFVTDVADLVFDLAEDIEPVVRLPGRNVQEINWKECRLSHDSYHARAFPISQLPQLPAAREQKIANWYANGQISKAMQMRLEQVPDTEGYMDLANASINNIFMMLDAIVEDEDYHPPEPFQDLNLALQIAQSKYLQERNRGTPQDRLDLLLTWCLQCDELIEQMGPTQIGLQSPATNPALAPPLQASPAQGAPAQLAAPNGA